MTGSQPTVIESTASPESPHVHMAIRVGVGALLAVAAGLKAYDVAFSLAGSAELFHNRWLLLCVVEIEVLLALLLFSGLWVRRVWLSSLGCFALFAGVSALKVWNGDVSCGCFGRIQVDPRYTLALDLIVLAALLRWPPKSTPRPAPYWKVLGVAALFLALAVPIGMRIATHTPIELTADDQLLPRGSLVLLKPANWVGKRLPLLNHIDIGEQLSRGTWTVVLFDRDCNHCRTAFPAYLDRARALAEGSAPERMALIEIPPFSGASGLRESSSLMYGRLRPDREWYARTPVELRLLDGQVVSAKDGGSL